VSGSKWPGAVFDVYIFNGCNGAPRSQRRQAGMKQPKYMQIWRTVARLTIWDGRWRLLTRSSCSQVAAQICSGFGEQTTINYSLIIWPVRFSFSC